MSDERPALPEGWADCTPPYETLSWAGPEAVLTYREDKGVRVWSRGRREASAPLAVLRAFVAECERVRGGGDG